MMLCYSERQRRAFTIRSTKDFKLEHLGVLFVISPSGAHVKVTTTPTIWANDLISTWRVIIALHHLIVSNWHAPLVAIGQEQWAQHKDKGPSTSSSKSTVENMNMVNRLYKASEKINQSKSYEHFTKLLISPPPIRMMTWKGCIGWLQTIKNRWGKNMEYVEEDE